MSKNERLLEELQKLESVHAEKEAEKTRSLLKLQSLLKEFNTAEQIIKKAKSVPENLKGFTRATGGYVLGRRNRKKLYNRAYRRKDAQNRLKKYTYHLYDLGFTERALNDLERLYSTTRDRDLKQAAAWELSLWHANKYTVEGAKRPFEYLPVAGGEIKDPNFLRAVAIIAAECADRTGDRTSAMKILETVAHHRHPDVFLAMANLESDLNTRIKWINKANGVYNLAPIVFNGDTYEDLAAINLPDKVKGPKVTVIMPSYNAAEGIGTGIESILAQTWENIELIIVDDCSQDNTIDVVLEYARKDERVKLLVTPENSGPYVARNIALREATGEFVTVNDADDWSHPEKIEIQAKHLMHNDNVIANTSEHARLTEELKLHRRGTPGTYIFSNMSSLMFRRQPVLEKIGYWDAVRFAADSEFKKRMAKVFGSGSVVDLSSGPLSFPRQSSGSLTGSSAFGYKGFLMGVRREYAEAHRRFHHEASPLALYYPFEQRKRRYPVPEPMWIEREEKKNGYRHFDIVIISDFRMDSIHHKSTIDEIRFNTRRGLRTGLIQMAHYDFGISREIDSNIRQLIDGNDVQMLVYGERIHAEVLLIKQPAVFQELQEYVPAVEARVARGVIEEDFKQLKVCTQHASEYVGKEVKWHPLDDSIRAAINNKRIRLSAENWVDYETRLDEWIL